MRSSPARHWQLGWYCLHVTGSASSHASGVAPAEPYLMNCPCKMSLKYASVTMNSDYNNRLYGGRVLGTVSVPASVPLLQMRPAYNTLCTCCMALARCVSA